MRYKRKRGKRANIIATVVSNGTNGVCDQLCSVAGGGGGVFAASDLVARLTSVDRILIKPNLVSTQPPPVTTPVALVEALIAALRELVPRCRITVAEGTGAIDHDTFHCFRSLGYDEMAVRLGVELLDLNFEPLVRKTGKDCPRLPEIYLPALLDEVFLLSVPVLKAHSMAGVTLTMKNMMGCLPPSKYRRGNSWGKSALHEQLDQAIVDLNRYRTPDFTVLDCTIGMAEAHLWGKWCSPPVGKLAASADPVAIDSFGADLLGRDWRSIDHIRMADGVIGSASPLRLVKAESFPCR